MWQVQAVTGSHLFDPGHSTPQVYQSISRMAVFVEGAARSIIIREWHISIYSKVFMSHLPIIREAMLVLQSLFLALLCTLAFGADLRGDLVAAGIRAVFPGDPDYVAASTVYNLRYDFKPAVITFPTTPKDVSTVLKISSALNMKASARSGGHSYIANSAGGKDGVVIIDMKHFDTITVNSSKQTVTLGSGNRLGDIALALSKHGRAMPHGNCPYIGIGGHAAYGGFGFTSRMWGLTLDNIVTMEVVLANGKIITVNDHQHSDLFWGMRGSGGSFGITTSMEIKTFPLPPSAVAFQYIWTLDAPAVAKGIGALESYAQTDIPPEIDVWIIFQNGPPKGSVVFHTVGIWYGPPDGLNATIAPFLENMPEGPEVIINPGTFIESLELVGPGPLDTHIQPEVPSTFYAKSLMTPQSAPMSLEARMAFANSIANEGSDTEIDWVLEFELYGGQNSALNAVPVDATAFAHRSSTFTIQLLGLAPGGVPPFPDSGIAFLDNLVDAIVSNNPPDWDYGAYPNYVDDRLPDWQKRYYGAHYPRLQALKRKYDPEDIFSFPTAVEE
ncbi:glucooligosaccharide oxidase [Collybia nuda]|uniref:Glucooligosaccharide oxidase n=1 Tax=Collybia nuda TaxID=64659 RepID=A0A9P5Y0D0_9AGAR|nr:glucooligosaccharide oxidase [Collybia nuda]